MWVRDVGVYMEDLCLDAERRRNEIAKLVPRGWESCICPGVGLPNAATVRQLFISAAKVRKHVSTYSTPLRSSPDPGGGDRLGAPTDPSAA